MIFGGSVDRTQFAPQVAGATSFDRGQSAGHARRGEKSAWSSPRYASFAPL